ncbi:MAG TPA: efflux RND transporter periplasmic adaptor subunit, partial [Myxococcota bacterium]
VAGRVEKVAADLGDSVKAGTVLVQLAREAPRLQAAQAEADFVTALARVGVDAAGLDEAKPENAAAVRRAGADREEATKNLQRVEELSRKGVAAQAELDIARTRAAAGEAAWAAARDEAGANIGIALSRRAALGLARKSLNDTSITSPVDGIVAARLVALGELVQPAQPVATVVIARELKLRGDVPERYADVVAEGLELEIDVGALSVVTKGKVARVGPLVDPASRTFPIEARIDNADGRLKPGTFARARVVVGNDEAVFAVPEVAVSNLAGVTKVFVVEDDKAVERPVQLLRKRGSDALITGALKSGDKVVITAIARMFGGADVTVDAGAPPTPSTDTPKTPAAEAK